MIFLVVGSIKPWKAEATSFLKSLPATVLEAWDIYLVVLERPVRPRRLLTRLFFHVTALVKRVGNLYISRNEETRTPVA
jgi:predicted amidophosphoribosyltransferase